MPWKFAADTPIYLQAAGVIRLRILTGEYPPGSFIPSVRELAQEAAVNPNTMQKALSRLETDGLLYTQRTTGRKVTEQQELIQCLRLEQARTHIAQCRKQLAALGFSPAETDSMLRRSVQTTAPETGGIGMTESNACPMLLCSGVVKSYGGKQVLRGVNLHLEPGLIVGLLGPNGSGKTTLMKLICGLLPPDMGVIQINGLPVGTQSKVLVSYLPERTYLGDWMTVKDALELFRDFYADFDWDKAMSMLARLGVDPAARLKTLSKGTREKVQLVLVMSRKALLYVLDEPIGGVDPAAREFILSTILTSYNEEGTILISTHLISDVEAVLDEAVFLKDGQIYLHESVDGIRASKGQSVDELFREVYRC